VLQVPTRKLGSLPLLLRPAALRGRLALDAELEGSIAEPRATALVTLRGLRASGSKDPLDVESKLSYVPARGRVEARAKLARTGAEVLDLEAVWQGDLLRAARPAAGAPPLSGSATVKLAELPLDVVPQLVDRQLSGRLSGEVRLEDWGKDARLDAQLSSRSLSIGKLAIERLDASAKSDAQKLSAQLTLAAAGGTTSASLDANMRWGQHALPVLERQGIAKVSMRAFRLDALTPLIGAYVSEVGGLLDASGELAVTPTSTNVKGEASLRRGVLQVPAIGQRFSDIEARVDLRDNQLRLEQLEARGTTGKLRISGSARLDGFELRGAEARASIGEREKLPITLEGQALGDAWGNLSVRYENPRQGSQRVVVDVPQFHLLVPENSGSGLQSLDESSEIRVGVHRADGKFVPLAVQPLEPGGQVEEGGTPPRPMVVEIALGNVTVERGRSVQAQLSGRLTLHSAATTELTGRIEVRGGKLDVQGKTFEIERGVITFDGGDPGNPTVTATARWDAPDYTVYADYVGDVETGRIKLRAEPPLTQDQIASLLLFGSPEGSAGGSDPTAASLAVSVAGDTAAQGLNKALDDLTNLDVSARIDTTTGSARPELVFRVSPRVAAKVTRAIGTPAAGESPDRTFLTLELRLKRAWALSALLGDHGASALDLIWRRRY
ncbi:MAG TPA: translocation/assembly module TamB domain-containing protein, partial [Polyangiaceae bacterium]